MALGKPIVYNGITINNRIDYNMVAPFYYVQVQSVDGLWGADLSYESHPIPNAIGEKSGDVFRRGKTITVSGTIWGRGLSEVYTGGDLLAQMLADKSIKQFRFTPWNHNIQLYINCRPYQDLSIVESFENETWRLAYVFALRADDPRSYKVSDSSLFPTWQQ